MTTKRIPDRRRAPFRTILLLALLMAGMGARVNAQTPPTWDTESDTWAATDALGRTLPTYAQVGPPRHNRTVGVFYFLWLGAQFNGGPYALLSGKI